jgi:peptidoglycan hydrolase CwlO-like protein
MQNLKIWLLICVAALGSLLLGVFVLPQALAIDPVDDLQKQIDDLARMRKMSEDATKPLESEIKTLESRITNAQAGIVSAKKQSEELAKSIDEREQDMAVQYKILTKRIADSYKRERLVSPLLIFLSTGDAAQLTKDLMYRSSVQAQDNRLIQGMGVEIATLEADREKLESDQVRLAALQKQLDEQADYFRKEVEKAKDYQQELSGKIAALSARQQEILNSRSGSFTVSGDSELADDYLASIQGFRESAPSGHFAVFSFGAYSHRNGMSQYGALGRAKSGQKYEEILKAYYPNASIKKDYNSMDQISVQGNGSGSFEDWYLMRIYEVPASWPKEVLKAQAIAARTFAIRYTDNGKKAICTTEACQVFKNSAKGGAWEEAVKETKGMVLVDGSGNPVSTQYASTHGGWTKTSGWDTTDGKGGSSLLEKSYEKIGGSPWLYKAWWREGYSKSGSTCGRQNPWMSPEEMADIVNAAIALKTGGIDTSRILPTTTSCWGGNPYSRDELRNLVKDHGGIDKATSVSVELGTGKTNKVTINGKSFSGDEFCKAFNLRASGYMRIPQWSGGSCVNAFFNIEKK